MKKKVFLVLVLIWLCPNVHYADAVPWVVAALETGADGGGGGSNIPGTFEEMSIVPGMWIGESLNLDQIYFPVRLFNGDIGTYDFNVFDIPEFSSFEDKLTDNDNESFYFQIQVLYQDGSRRKASAAGYDEDSVFNQDFVHDWEIEFVRLIVKELSISEYVEDRGGELPVVFYKYNYKIRYEFYGTPEPSTMLLLGSGLIGLAGIRRKFRKK